MLPLNGVCLSIQCDIVERSWCTCSSHISCKYLGDKLQCSCGEEWKIYEWNWTEVDSTNNIQLSNSNRDVVFHPVYSSGTAALKGQQKLKQNLHYYWEIKMLTNLYGTDIMVGIGTSKVEISDCKLRFCSMLGYDKESWGYSYRGTIQHAKRICKYGPRFTIGSLVGIHVDMCAGTVEFYLNRKPLGIAFRELKNRELYPMVCSTAAQSAMRLTCAVSEIPTLQMECLKVINNNAKLLQQYWDIPGLAKIIGQKYFWMAPKPAEEASALELEDEVVLPTEYLNRNFIRRKRFCPGLFQFNDPHTDPDHFAYEEVLSAKEKHHTEVLKDCNKGNNDSDMNTSFDINHQKDVNIYDEENTDEE